jgi:hypothetical protein
LSSQFVISQVYYKSPLSSSLNAQDLLSSMAIGSTLYEKFALAETEAWVSPKKPREQG